MKKTITLVTLALLFSFAQGANQVANDSSKTAFYSAFDALKNMLEGKDSLNYEKAIFITENAYYDNKFSFEYFSKTIDSHIKIIDLLAEDAKQQFPDKYKTMRKFEQKMFNLNATNWAIYKYITDTIIINDLSSTRYKLPFNYSNDDPYGSSKWENTQVLNLLNNNIEKGNCYALTSLFKIFSDRLKSEARLVTTPHHIYIQNCNTRGDFKNIELATKTFPGDGSIQTLTYTTKTTIMDGMAQQPLTDKQTIALNLIYLAKGFEHKFNDNTNDFLLQCADLVIKHDSLSMNALLLKAEITENRLFEKLKENKISTVAQARTNSKTKILLTSYEKQLSNLYNHGYREIPKDIQHIILSAMQGNKDGYITTDKTPNPFAEFGEKTRYATLSWGLFDEMHYPVDTIQYFHASLNTKKNKIIEFLPADTSKHYKVDPVVFAMSIDPLAAKYPDLSPYSAFANNPIMFVDQDGREPRWGQLASLSQIKGEMGKVYTSNAVSQMSLSNLLGAMQQHFEANRMFRYDEQGGKFNEISSASSNVKRYMYTEKSGWVDMNHFFALAQKTLDYGSALAKEYAYESENMQGAYKGSESAYSYEDLPSNFAGIDFIKKYGSDLKAGKIGLMDAVETYFKDLGATDPTNAPNIDYIPYFADDKAPKNFTPQGLTGDKLKNASKESFSKKSPKAQERIKKAQGQITN